MGLSRYLRDLQHVIVAAPAKFCKISLCPLTHIVALQTQPELGRCNKKLLLLLLKQQRSGGEHCIINLSLDGMAKGATAIAEATGLWREAAGLCGALYLSPSPSLSLTTHSHAHTRFVESIIFSTGIRRC